MDKLFSKKGLSLDRLNTLIQVVDSGGIAAAAPGDPVRQSQFSRQISQLETFFGTGLTERSGKGIRITSEGRELARISRRFLASLEEYYGRVGTGRFEIRIAASGTVLDWLVIPAIVELRRTFPSLQIQLIGMKTQETATAVRDGLADIGVVRKNAVLPTFQLAAEGEIPVQYKLFCFNELARENAYSTSQILARNPLVTNRGGEFRNRMESILFPGDRSETNPVQIECSSFREAIGVLKRDKGVCAILPTWAQTELLHENQFIGIDLPALEDYDRALTVITDPKQCENRPFLRQFSRQFNALIGKEMEN